MLGKSKRLLQVCSHWIERSVVCILTIAFMIGLCMDVKAEQKTGPKKDLLENLPPLPQKSETVDRLGPVAVGEQAPWFAALDARGDGNPVNLKMLRERNNEGVVILVFFSTWCKPCINGLRLIATQKKELARVGVTVCLVDVNEEPEEVVAFVDALGLEKVTVVVDKFCTNARSFGVIAPQGDKAELPRTFVIKNDGEVLRIFKIEGKDFIAKIVEVAR